MCLRPIQIRRRGSLFYLEYLIAGYEPRTLDPQCLRSFWIGVDEKVVESLTPRVGFLSESLRAPTRLGDFNEEERVTVLEL